jgi:mannitol-1-phosphate 5-dehydrogenase
MKSKDVAGMVYASGQSYVGFGFGPIQSALFVLEAFRSGLFKSFTIAEIDPTLVAAVRGNGGRFTVNIAHADRIEVLTVSGVTLLNPNDALDRAAILAAIAQADVLGTALPSVAFYARGGDTSVTQMLAEGLAQRSAAGRPAIIYTAENNNHAAEILTAELQAKLPPDSLTGVQALNTVIGKMSGVITDAAEIARLGLAPLAPGVPKAVLVEAFNRILISRVKLAGFAEGGSGREGIPAFVEKDNLLPFEEAKLYGHNAVHSLIGYLAHERGLATMDLAAAHADIMAAARAAFLEESGVALCRKHAALGDALFTAAGFRAYADDLLARMVNPNLSDKVARVIRDPDRKLGADDRLFGTMRLALAQGVEPVHFARGAAAAARFLAAGKKQKIGSRQDLAALLTEVWADTAEAVAAHPLTRREAEKLIDLTWAAWG